MTETTLSTDTIMVDYGLKAQTRLSPYVMGYFGVGLPVFLWAMSLSLSPWWLTLYLPLFVAAWIVFMVLKGQCERLEAGPQDSAVIGRRMWRHGVSSAVWTATLMIISLPAGRYGVSPEMMLMICASAA